MIYVVHKTATKDDVAQMYQLSAHRDIDAITTANDWDPADHADEEGYVDWKQVVDTASTANGENDTPFITVYNIDTEEVVYGQIAYE